MQMNNPGHPNRGHFSARPSFQLSWFSFSFAHLVSDLKCGFGQAFWHFCLPRWVHNCLRIFNIICCGLPIYKNPHQSPSPSIAICYHHLGVRCGCENCGNWLTELTGLGLIVTVRFQLGILFYIWILKFLPPRRHRPSGHRKMDNLCLWQLIGKYCPAKWLGRKGFLINTHWQQVRM